MRKTFRIVEIREQRIPTGVYVMVGLQEEAPPEKAQGGLLAQIKGAGGPDIQQALGPIFAVLGEFAGGAMSNFALTPEEYKKLGSPTVGRVVNVDLELFGE